MPKCGKVGILVQARMGSKRLPGKALIEIEGKPLLHRLCNRMKLCRRADEVIVATSDEPQDDAIAEACARWGNSVFRGPEKDLTARLLGAAEAHGLSSFVRVTADNPLTDPGGIDNLIDALLGNGSGEKSRAVLVHNMHRHGYPYGTGAEAANRSLLEWCDQQLVGADERECFALYVKQHPRQFCAVRIDAAPHLRRPYFLTVDHREDLELLRAIYSHFAGRDEMGLEDVNQFLDSNPGIAKLNSHLHQQFPE
ncbi:MAG TPA: NTP transferase domain-containing protein [Candidatus Acidoferrales bacterium]|nr:NTP transferase domain-containing protein [Candidatus Acidoferrales bacterium]